MKTLYTRIVVTFIFISMISSILALLASGAYYQTQLKSENEQKILAVGKQIRALYESMPELELDAYLNRIANMGFQIYAVNDRMEGTYYGGPFKHKQLDTDIIKGVLRGEIYEGIREARQLFLIGFFENSLRNSVGIPLTANGQNYALFIRPNLEQQVGEIRILMAVLLGLAFLFSVALIVVLSRSIVKPVKKLTEATNQIVGGNYDFRLHVTRRDEIGNLARHFTMMAQSLKQLDAMRQEFVSNVSHEIQSPLTSIQGFAQAILDKEASPDEAEKYLHIISEESRRLSSLSKQLLTLASLDKETNVLRGASYRLDEQIRQVLIVTEWQWSEKQLTIEPVLPEIVICADPQLLYQVWFNLIVNSIKFTSTGGFIRIELSVGQDIAVKIEDSGIGIGEAELPHIFERFYKADQSRSPSRSGSGLGLSIVKKIVDLHRGSIEVRSFPGKGTVFTVRLPR
ncbi:sensor histidine kinase [Paenibacillus thermotolerans]|uniref:sensor histidine kinase n=1 Tax=Paenibacillus thermotolerans TaxID=3027807 RepID=UPI0023682A36|nr:MULTISPECIES: HAMP domain-containing sensor histidine kinase [unclassified Paenibacillus]